MLHDDNRLKLEIPARPDWVVVARLAVAAGVNRLALSSEQLDDVKLLTAEACALCVHQAGPGETLTIVCELGTDRIVLSVRIERTLEKRDDQPQSEPDTDALETSEFIIRSIVDEADISYDPISGPSCKITKFLVG